jgi:hypothetical protein
MSTKQKPRHSDSELPDLSTVNALDLIDHVSNTRTRMVQLELVLSGIILPLRDLGPEPHVSLAQLEAAWELAGDVLDEIGQVQIDLGADEAEVAL